jgi:ribosomal protein S18 acetylase RimI-like enzyme
MGVRREWRRRGIGRRLLEACLWQALQAGLEKVELEVYPDNQPAVLLYKGFRFVEEGLRRRARKLDGRYQDIQLMALWLSNSALQGKD